MISHGLVDEKINITPLSKVGFAKIPFCKWVLLNCHSPTIRARYTFLEENAFFPILSPNTSALAKLPVKTEEKALPHLPLPHLAPACSPLPIIVYLSSVDDGGMTEPWHACLSVHLAVAVRLAVPLPLDPHRAPTRSPLP